jgi:hypothetical protein
MSHGDAWQLVGGDILIPMIYAGGPFFFGLTGYFSTKNDAHERDQVPGVFCCGLLLTVISHLISAGVIK